MRRKKRHTDSHFTSPLTSGVLCFLSSFYTQSSHSNEKTNQSFNSSFPLSGNLFSCPAFVDIHFSFSLSPLSRHSSLHSGKDEHITIQAGNICVVFGFRFIYFSSSLARCEGYGLCLIFLLIFWKW